MRFGVFNCFLLQKEHRKRSLPGLSDQWRKEIVKASGWGQLNTLYRNKKYAEQGECISLPVFYSSRPKETFELTYDFIRNKFGHNASDKFLSKAKKNISHIAENPFMFKASTIDENGRIALITKQCSLFYGLKSIQLHFCFSGITARSSYCRYDKAVR